VDSSLPLAKSCPGSPIGSEMLPEPRCRPFWVFLDRTSPRSFKASARCMILLLSRDPNTVVFSFQPSHSTSQGIFRCLLRRGGQELLNVSPSRPPFVSSFCHIYTVTRPFFGKQEGLSGHLLFFTPAVPIREAGRGLSVDPQLSPWSPCGRPLYPFKNFSSTSGPLQA